MRIGSPSTISAFASAFFAFWGEHLTVQTKGERFPLAIAPAVSSWAKSKDLAGSYATLSNGASNAGPATPRLSNATTSFLPQKKMRFDSFWHCKYIIFKVMGKDYSTILKRLDAKLEQTKYNLENAKAEQSQVEAELQELIKQRNISLKTYVTPLTPEQKREQKLFEAISKSRRTYEEITTFIKG